MKPYCRKSLRNSSFPRFLHSAVLLGDLMLVFGGSSHNGTSQGQSNFPCFSMDFVAYSLSKLSQLYVPGKLIQSSIL